MRQTNNIYGFDTETDNDGETAWIAQWALSNGKKERHGTDLESFKTDCLGYLANKKGKSYVYVWNLKYDLEFIKRGLAEFCEEWGYKLDIVMRKGNPINIKLKAPKDRRIQSEIIFRDGIKKMQGSLRSIAPIFGMQKLEGPEFVPGWSAKEDFTDPESWDYVHMDARIVAVAMQHFHKQGFVKSTASGDAWYTFKNMFCSDKNGKQLKDKDGKFQIYFPKLPYELDHDLRDGFWGGVNISMRNGMIVGIITHDDITSMYPTCLNWDPMPISIPSRQEEIPADGLLWVGKLRLKFRLKPNRVAWFQFKNGADCVMEGIEFGTPVINTEHFHNLTLTNVDFITLSMDYDIEEDPDEYGRYFYVFKQKEGLFKDYIERFIKQKNEAAKGSPERAQAKIMLNSLYGRFALIPEGENVTLVYDAESDDYKWRTEATINEEMDAYLPISMFTTSYARARLMHMIRKLCDAYGADCIIHSDTDSVIHTGPRLLDPELEYDNGLGTWALESEPVRIYEGGFKRYIEILHEPVQSLKDISMACAGVPQQTNTKGVPVGMWVELLDDPDKITTNTVLGHTDYSIKSEWLRKLYTDAGVNPDKVNTMKLLPDKVKGGIILREHTHELSDNMSVRLRR